MGIAHKLNKLKIYFQQDQNYWRLSDPSNQVVDSKTGAFFLNLIDRLEDKHYDKFDSDGFPIRQYEGKVLYNYTTLCSYALAHWQVYLETGNKQYTEQVFKTVGFLKKHHEVTTYGGIVFPFKGKLSAMNQGEALSVVARAYEYSGDPSLITFANNILKAYNISVSDYGVLGQFNDMTDVYWYEERAEVPHKHILNGMIYAMIGLYEISIVMPELVVAKELYENGLKYLGKALPLFDNGYWSWYWVDESKPNYTASVMYHNLHICQLKHLYKLSGSPELKHFADQFENYYSKPLNRIRSGINLAIGKWRMK